MESWPKVTPRFDDTSFSQDLVIMEEIFVKHMFSEFVLFFTCVECVCLFIPVVCLFASLFELCGCLPLYLCCVCVCLFICVVCVCLFICVVCVFASAAACLLSAIKIAAAAAVFHCHQ